jgi:putative membrane protein
VFWWPLIAPVPERAGFHPLGKIAYLALNAFLIRPPFAMMIFSEHPIYAIYELAPPVARDALHDQQLAGAIMKIGVAWIMFAAVLVVFQRWRRAEAEVRP